jgi:hypothetical protein
VKFHTESEIYEKVDQVWCEHSKGNDGCCYYFKREVVCNYPRSVSITLSDMYSSPVLNLKKLMELAEFFDTKNINDDDRFSNEGCDTCDYGSSYGFTLTVRPEVDNES